jgi:hypothetical protein
MNCWSIIGATLRRIAIPEPDEGVFISCLPWRYNGCRPGITRADGASYAYSFSTNYDGNDSAITGTGAPGGADTIALKRLSSRKVEGTLKKDGKAVGKVAAEVSKDGKLATVKAKGKTADGKEFSTDSVYDKQ